MTEALEPLPPLPPKVAAALSTVMGKVQKLGKDEKNPHANYKYAGIESFLEMVRPLCAGAGLIIVQDEEGFEFRDATDKYGKALTWLVMTFSFGLAHSSGETWPYRCKRTGMVQASMGSQAFGAAQSYALKSFLRSIGLIATGDSEDADSHEQRDLPVNGKAKTGAATAHEEAPKLNKSTGKAEYEKLQNEISAITSVEKLRAWGNTEAWRIQRLPDDWRSFIRERWSDRKIELEEGVTEDGEVIEGATA